MTIISFIEKILSFFKKKDTKEDIKKDLSGHMFFYTLHYICDVRIHTVPIEHPAKRKLVIAYITNVRVGFEDRILELVKNDTFDFSNTTKVFLEAIASVDDEMKKSGTPEEFISRFKEWNEVSIDICLKSLNDIITSNYLSDDHSMKVAILNTLTFYLQLLIINIERTVNTFNGDLEKALKGTIYDS